MRIYLAVLAVGVVNHASDAAECPLEPPSIVINHFVSAGEIQRLDNYVRSLLPSEWGSNPSLSAHVDASVSAISSARPENRLLRAREELKMLCAAGAASADVKPTETRIVIGDNAVIEGGVKLGADTEDGADKPKAVAKPSGCFKGRPGGSDDSDSCFNLLLGTVQSLEDDGSFHSGGEASLRSVTKLDSFEKYDVPDWTPSIYGFVEATISELGAIDEAVGEESMDGEPPSFNPFATEGSFFRANLGTDLMFTDHLGLQLGVGFSSRPGDGVTLDEVSRRSFGGFLVRGTFGSNVAGSAMLGIAEDDFWNYEYAAAKESAVQLRESDRYIFDSRLNLPNFFENDSIQASLRLFADLPRSGDGPSDVRVSFLVDVALDSVFNNGQ